MTDRIADCRLELSHYMPQLIMLIHSGAFLAKFLD